MIKRKKYIDKIKKYIDIELIKVITWLRRSGKTYFIRQIIDYLENDKWISNDNIIHIDKEDLKFDLIKDYKDLYNYIENITKNIKWKIYLFIDEIQDILEWENTIRNYAKKINFDIYITWSNSTLLSWELATYLTWRYIEIHIYPLNFGEFLEFRKSKNTIENWFWWGAWSGAWNRDGSWYWIWWEEEKKILIKDEFKNYIKYLGLPAIHKMEFSDELIYWYISWVFNSIVLKDIVSRYNIRNTNLLIDIFKFLWDNIWNIVSSKKISDYLKKEKINISVDTIKEYLRYFENTFLLNKVNRYDLKWKKILELYEKYYLWDLWFKSYLLWYKQGDIWQDLENIVYLELLSRWYEVNIWKVNNLEIDFIAKKGWITEYFQVTYLLASEDTIKREFWVFDKLKDNYKKTVLSLDDFFSENYNGINRKNIIDWLLE